MSSNEQPGSRQEFEKFWETICEKHSIRSFSVEEILVLGSNHANPRARGYQKNHLPPKSLFENIILPIIVCQKIRDELGKPITFSNVYRSPAYNRAVGGVKRSSHMRFCAMDIKSSSVKPSEIFEVARKLRKEGIFKGGLGLYRTFCHLDCRGSNATWRSGV